MSETEAVKSLQDKKSVININDIKEIISIVTTLFIISGFIYNIVFFNWFNVSFYNFYTITDYLTTSVGTLLFSIIYIVIFISLLYVYRLLIKDSASKEIQKRNLFEIISIFFLWGVIFYQFGLPVILSIFNKIAHNVEFDIIFYKNAINLSGICFTSLFNIIFNKLYSGSNTNKKNIKIITMLCFLFIWYLISNTYENINKIEKSLKSKIPKIQYTLKEDKPKYKDAILLNMNSNYVFLINQKREVFVLPKDSFKEFKTN